MDEWFGRFFQTFGLKLAAWVGLLMVGVHWFKARSERLRDIHAEKAGDWARLRDEVARLSDRLKAVEAENDECRKNLAAVRDELAEEKAARVRIEAYLEGRGQADQYAQLIVSSERSQDARKREDGK